MAPSWAIVTISIAVCVMGLGGQPKIALAQSAAVADAATDASADDLIDCLLIEQRGAKSKRISPNEFALIVRGSCLGQKSIFRQNATRYFVKIGVRDGVAISNLIDGQIQKLEDATIGNYAKTRLR